MPSRRAQLRRAGSGTPWPELRFVLILSVIALAITSIPYAAGAMMATEERVFGGFVYAVADCYSYLAKMRQGAEGAWLFHIPYTPEAHPGAIFYAFRRLLGKIATLVPGGNLTTRMIWVYHLARWVFGLGLLVTIYQFLTRLTRSVRIRRLAWLMTTFGSGLGWLLIALGRPNWLGSLPLGFLLPEGFTFLVLFSFPHLALAQTLFLLGLLALLKAWRLGEGDAQHTLDGARSTPYVNGHSASQVSWPAALKAGLLWLLMGLVVPFYPAVAWSVAGAAWIALTLRERRFCWSEAGAAAVAALISAPILIYSAWRFGSHPVYGAWQAQSQVSSPHPLHYLAAYGLPLAFAALATREAWNSKTHAWVALAWVALGPFLIYPPINEQRRLIVGVQVPLNLLAAIGLSRVTGLESSTTSLRSKLVAGVVLLALLPTNAMLIAGSTMTVSRRPSPIYRDKEEVAALDWLSQEVNPASVVLASYKTGNYLPVRVGAHAFVGHGAESAHIDQKRAQVAQFFTATSEDDWRRHLLETYGIDYVFWGPMERELGTFDPSAAPYLRQVHEAEDYVIFTVQP